MIEEEMVEKKHSEMNMIEKAERAAQRLEKANLAMQELIKKQELIEARRLFGGRAEAGVVKHIITDEDKTKEDMKNYFKGTAIEQAL